MSDRLRRILVILGFVAIVAAVAFAIYYVFFRATPVATNTLGASRELYATALGVASNNGQIDKEAIHSKWVQADRKSVV